MRRNHQSAAIASTYLAMSTGQKPKILILGDFSYSRAQGAHVALGLGKPLRDAGFSPEFLAAHMDETGVRSDFQEFVCHFPLKRRLLRGWRAAVSGLLANDDGLIKWLEKSVAGEFSAVIAYPGSGSTVGFLVRLHRLCLKMGFKLIVVVCEWQRLWQSDGSKLRDRVMASLDSEIQRRVVNKQIMHIIVVSTLLERYYRKSGCDVIRMPPLIDAQAEKWNCRPTTEGPKSDLTLLFSGSWCRDRLDLIMEAVQYLRRDGNRIVLKFLGSGPNELQRSPRLQRQMAQAPPDTFGFHGWVPFERVLPITASADFGVLLRDPAKWSDACFPSKVAEFQALGVPLLCNLTADLQEYLVDGENALVVPHVSVAAFVTTVKRALALAPAEMHHMRQCSLQCAARRFDYRIYSDSLGQFIRHPPTSGMPSSWVSGPRQV